MRDVDVGQTLWHGYAISLPDMIRMVLELPRSALCDAGLAVWVLRWVRDTGYAQDVTLIYGYRTRLTQRVLFEHDCRV